MNDDTLHDSASKSSGPRSVAVDIRDLRKTFGTAEGLGDSSLGRGRGRCGHDCFELDGRQLTEHTLTSAPVIGPFDPGHDGEAEVVAGGPALTVEHVLLEQCEERFHGRVVAGGTDPAARGTSQRVVEGSYLDVAERL